jgi:two-component system, LytTR family, response regulator
LERIRTAIADDEEPARERLLDLLAQEPDVEIAGAARDGAEAIGLIRSARPDLLFLDVQMPAVDGFGVLEQVGPRLMPVTVFVTAYDRYAIQAFEAHALGYLLKPFSDERFEAVLERARRSIRGRRASELGERLALLVAQRGAADRLAIRSGGRVIFLDLAEIDWIEAAGVYVNLHCGAKVYLHRTTFGQLQQRLDPARFVRIHRSAIVNTDRIKELLPRSHGEYTVVLKTGARIAMSRNYRPQLEAWLQQAL